MLLNLLMPSISEWKEVKIWYRQCNKQLLPTAAPSIHAWVFSSSSCLPKLLHPAVN